MWMSQNFTVHIQSISAENDNASTVGKSLLNNKLQIQEPPPSVAVLTHTKYSVISLVTETHLRTKSAQIVSHIFEWDISEHTTART